MTQAWAKYCARCGEEVWTSRCVHPIQCTADVTISVEEVERIRARYAWGKLYNPDHDTTSYRDGNSDATANISEQEQAGIEPT